MDSVLHMYVCVTMIIKEEAKDLRGNGAEEKLKEDRGVEML